MVCKNWRVVTKSRFLLLDGVCENFDFDPLISNFFKAQWYDFQNDLKRMLNMLIGNVLQVKLIRICQFTKSLEYSNISFRIYF